VEAAADDIPHAARRHAVERAGEQLASGGVAGARPGEQEVEARRRRELRRGAETAPAHVVAAGEQVEGGVCRALGVGSARAVAAVVRGQLLDEVRRLRRDARAVAPPRLGHRGEHLGERRHAIAALGREVGAAVERLQVRGQEDGERPAAAAGHRLHGAHVHRVDVGPLLAVDLDRHELGVEEGGDRRILERLVGHDVAPVAGGVADRQEDRFVFSAGAGESLVSPRVPVDRVVLVLQQVRAGLARESVETLRLAHGRLRPGPAPGRGRSARGERQQHRQHARRLHARTNPRARWPIPPGEAVARTVRGGAGMNPGRLVLWRSSHNVREGNARMAAEHDEFPLPPLRHSEVPSLGSRPLRGRARWFRWAWTAGGMVSLAIGVIGVAVPVLPTTPFLLLATACFLRGSERMHRWMLTNRWFGDYLRRYREGRGIPVRTKVGAILLLWTTIGLSATLVVENWAVRIGLLLVAAAVTVHIAMIGRRRGSRIGRDAPGVDRLAGDADQATIRASRSRRESPAFDAGSAGTRGPGSR
jgi:uncharacterized membrane protein YbaN (DUF454 family)